MCGMCIGSRASAGLTLGTGGTRFPAPQANWSSDAPEKRTGRRATSRSGDRFPLERSFILVGSFAKPSPRRHSGVTYEV